MQWKEIQIDGEQARLNILSEPRFTGLNDLQDFFLAKTLQTLWLKNQDNH
jgi:hypothetical protein